jgi:uncharacterized protein DUF3987
MWLSSADISKTEALMPPPTLSRQIEILTKHIKQISPAELQDGFAEKVITWVRDLPVASRPVELIDLLKRKLNIDQATLDVRLRKGPKPIVFEDLLPKAGWLYDYIQYTQNTEPPTPFHFFAGVTAIGAALARNVHFDMGAYQIFPNPCVVIVAPTGKCRKTSACNIAVSLFRAIGGNILADKVTPEALVTAFEDRTSATGLIYAPELAVFLGKQKYNEGMVPLLTALFDCPKEWSSLTVMNGERRLRNVALSALMCSTMDWIQTAIPKDAFGGGFMSRLLFVVQNETNRCFPHPPPLSPELEHKLKERLFQYSKIKGQFTIEQNADDWYINWYKTRDETTVPDKQFAGYAERKADHMHRLAMILTVSELQSERASPDLLRITRKTMQRALAILNWVESQLPAAFSEMTQNTFGEETAKMLKQIKAKGGFIAHSTWLRMNSNRLNKDQFKAAVATLREAKLVDFDPQNKSYSLTPEGWTK